MNPKPIMKVLSLVLALTGQAQPQTAPPTPPVKIILDVDLAEDVDDAGALATLHALANLGEAEILGILISSRNEWVGPCADAINTYFRWDTGASVRAVNDWPTPVVFSGFAIGAAIKVGSRLQETPEANPVRACYQHYNGLQNREAWDQTAVLCAVRGVSHYWKVSEPGFCLMHARVSHGWNEWIPTPQKEHRYLVESMPPKAVGKVIEDLMLAPPRVGNR